MEEDADRRRRALLAELLPSSLVRVFSFQTMDRSAPKGNRALRSRIRQRSVHPHVALVHGPVPRATRRGGAVTGEVDAEARMAALMEQVSRGDREAFTLLYQELCGPVRAIVHRVARDPAITEEVTQEALLEVWRLASRYDRTKGSVRSWAAGIAQRRAIDHVRSQEASRRRDDRVGRLESAHDDGASGEIDACIDRDRLSRALEQLTDLQRQSVELAYYAGYTYREVAVLLDLPEGTVKTRIRDGLIRLRVALSHPKRPRSGPGPRRRR